MKIKKHSQLGILLAILTILQSCNDNSELQPDPDVVKIKESVILLYAVASNNLEKNLTQDKNEILSTASNLDLNRNSFFLYEVTYDFEPQLLELVKNSKGEFEFQKIKDYPNTTSSVSPERISEVIEDVKILREAGEYGLILWSHGTGLDPYAGTRSSEYDIAVASFGSDKDPVSSTRYEINIDELADAIPDGFFNFIWFDACYMSGIETIYEFRDKCNYFVGYPTEVFEWGMAYDKVLPHILKGNPDLVGAAEDFFNFYALNPNYQARIATIVVTDMSRLEPVADFCKGLYAVSDRPNSYDLIRFTRGSVGPFYDFGDYTSQMCNDNIEEYTIDEWKKLLSDLIIYNACTEYDFNGIPIDKDRFSGISCHLYNPESGKTKDEYYNTLDWCKRVY